MRRSQFIFFQERSRLSFIKLDGAIYTIYAHKDSRFSARSTPRRSVFWCSRVASMRASIREGSRMERFIADLVKNYESGKVDRREFCKTVALAATVYAAGDAANAQAPRGFKMLGINHISYTCPDYTKVRDWYVSVLGMESTPGKDSGKRANLMFGPEPGKGGAF